MRSKEWLAAPTRQGCPFITAPREQCKTLGARIPKEPLFVSLVRTEEAQVFRAGLCPLLSAVMHSGALGFGRGLEERNKQPAGEHVALQMHPRCHLELLLAPRSQRPEDPDGPYYSPSQLTPTPRRTAGTEMAFQEEGRARQVHCTCPRHLKGTAGQRALFCMGRGRTRGEVIGGDLGLNVKGFQRPELSGGTVGCADRQ